MKRKGKKSMFRKRGKDSQHFRSPRGKAQAGMSQSVARKSM
jgi:hypothetical protein